MRLTLRATGGFTGPAGAVTREVDLDQLPPASRDHARALAADAHLFDRPPRMLRSPPRPQDFRYRLQATDGGRSHEIEFHLDAVDAPLRRLVKWMEDEVEPRGAVP